MATLTVRTAQTKSPVSLLSANHPSTLVLTTLLSASHPIRSAMAKWTVLTARTKDPSVVMFALSVLVISSFGLLSWWLRCKVILYLKSTQQWLKIRQNRSHVDTGALYTQLKMKNESYFFMGLAFCLVMLKLLPQKRTFCCLNHNCISVLALKQLLYTLRTIPETDPDQNNSKVSGQGCVGLSFFEIMLSISLQLMFLL